MRLSCALTATFIALVIGCASGDGATAPFAHTSRWILATSRGAYKQVKTAKTDIPSALKSLAKTQSALKSLDGATHVLRTALAGEAPSLQARFEEFQSAKKKQPAEATKLWNYVTAVERGMQAAEFLQVAMSEDAAYAKDAGIEILWNETLHGPLTVDIMALKKVDSELPCLVFVTRNSTADELAVLESQPMALRLSTTGVVSETVLVNRPLFQMAVNALVRLKPRLQLDTPAEAEDQGEQEASEEEQVDAAETDHIEAPATQAARNATSHYQQRIQFVGYSTGGAVASYVAMLLDGTLNVTTTAADAKYGKAASPLASLSQARPCIGAAPGKVYCVTLGCPPCISRSVVPQYVISIINGDDLVARADPDSLMELKSSVHTRVREKAHESKASRWLESSARVAGGLLGVASRGIREHATAKYDYISLKPPGKVFFMKKRKQHQGATFTRVLRGNIREDVLWQLHDIVVSTSMERHHSLEDYIHTLRRV